MNASPVPFLRAKSVLQTVAPHGHIGLPDVCCDLYWWDGRLQFAGPATSATVAPFAGHSVTIVCLDPLAAGAWLGVPMAELTNQVFDLADIDKRRASEISTLFETVGVAGFPSGPAAPSSGDDRVRFAAAALRAGRSVARIADRLELSQRQLERIFFDHTGLTPKRFAGVVRFRRAVFAAKGGQSLSQAASSAGYADQAHLTRESGRLTGQTPRKLLPNVGKVQDLIHGSWE